MKSPNKTDNNKPGGMKIPNQYTTNLEIYFFNTDLIKRGNIQFLKHLKSSKRYTRVGWKVHVMTSYLLLMTVLKNTPHLVTFHQSILGLSMNFSVGPCIHFHKFLNALRDREEKKRKRKIYYFLIKWVLLLYIGHKIIF